MPEPFDPIYELETAQAECDRLREERDALRAELAACHALLDAAGLPREETLAERVRGLAAALEYTVGERERLGEALDAARAGREALVEALERYGSEHSWSLTEYGWIWNNRPGDPRELARAALASGAAAPPAPAASDARGEALRDASSAVLRAWHAEYPPEALPYRLPLTPAIDALRAALAAPEAEDRAGTAEDTP